MSQVSIDQIRTMLAGKADERTRLSGQRYFKEEVRLYGIKSADIRTLAKVYYPDLKIMDKREVFGLCAQLWQSGYLEEAAVACIWSHYIRKSFNPGDFSIFEGWISKYVTNWATCDTFCNHTMGAFLEMYPDYLVELRRWALSPNKWLRRASAVSLIIPARQGKFLEDILGIAGILLSDKEDMVQKGYGWMLKSASQVHQKEVFDFVMRHKQTMPRTALRYAIEKMPAHMKRAAMDR